MTLRSGRPSHGRSEPHVEVLAPDELPSGVQAPEQVEAGDERTLRGTWTKGARTAQSKGGRALRERTALGSQLGLAKLDGEAAFAPYRAKAAPFARAQCGTLARAVGGGLCGPAPSSLVYSAALQLAASRYLSDRAAAEGNPALFIQASRLANDSRQNLLAAHELCAREAKSRPRETPQQHVARMVAALDRKKEQTR